MPPPDLTRRSKSASRRLGLYLTDKWLITGISRLADGGNELTLFKQIKPTQTQA